jgi:hypothetical protein
MTLKPPTLPIVPKTLTAFCSSPDVMDEPTHNGTLIKIGGEKADGERGFQQHELIEIQNSRN